ncbi:MAG: hypothetical protein SVM80_13675, partial [Halobacteriota archaeon]|nr:hypothetical protein [Halobacteriota archaeon]
IKIKESSFTPMWSAITLHLAFKRKNIGALTSDNASGKTAHPYDDAFGRGGEAFGRGGEAFGRPARGLPDPNRKLYVCMMMM